MTEDANAGSSSRRGGASLYVLARTKGEQSWEAVKIYDDLITAADAALALSAAEPGSVYRVVADGRRTVLLATRGIGHWVRVVR